MPSCTTGDCWGAIIWRNLILGWCQGMSAFQESAKQAPWTGMTSFEVISKLESWGSVMLCKNFFQVPWGRCYIFIERALIVEAPELSMAIIHSKKGCRSNMSEWIETLVCLMLQTNIMSERATFCPSGVSSLAFWAPGAKNQWANFMNGLSCTGPNKFFHFCFFLLTLKSD